MAKPRKPPIRRRNLDSPWKESLHHFLKAILAFFWPDLHDNIDWTKGYFALDKEFQQISRGAKVGRGIADKLFRVCLKNGKCRWIFTHVEIQGQKQTILPRRMFQYNYRCFDLYGRRVLSVAILCDNDSAWRPNKFGYGGFGAWMGIRFKSVKLLDWKGREAELENHDNPIAQVVLAHLEAEATRDNDEARLSKKIHLVKGLYSRGWSKDDIRHLFRILDWIMELPEDIEEKFRTEICKFEEEQRMPYVTSIERLAIKQGRQEGEIKGRQEGEIKGRQEGLELGERKGMINAVVSVLRSRFGSRSSKLKSKLEAVPETDRLNELLIQATTAASLDDFRALL